jgi:membrane protein
VQVSFDMRLYRTWRVARSLAARTSASNLGLIAAGVAFFGILAMFPALAALVALWGLVADPALVAAELEPLREILPPQAFDILSAQIGALTGAPAARLGWATGLSVGAALWSSRAGVAALVQGINAVHGVENRGGIGHQAVSLMLTLALVGVALALFAAGVVVPLVLALLPLGMFEQALVRAVRWTLLPAVTLVGLGLLFRYGPNLAEARPRFLSPGLWLALILWIAASEGFAFYLANFASYNAVYGSIGAVVALMMWLYVSAWSVLLGAALNAELMADHGHGP